MSDKYTYKGKDLSALILAKIEHVSSMIAERGNVSFDEAYTRFIPTKTFNSLVNPETLMWSESAEYVLGEYC
ncbi:MAG TPA: hypothetical protein DEB24_01860, partial [Coriobacteriia bacterium]|nr:hypothetical protein [Coriobacteriia bacterium]